MKAIQDIIIKPVITEKSMATLDAKCYTFRVHKDATKPEIAKAVEEMFGVKVASVNTSNVKKKPKRLGASSGYVSGWKKAVVTLKPESKSIAFFDSMN